MFNLSAMSYFSENGKREDKIDSDFCNSFQFRASETFIGLANKIVDSLESQTIALKDFPVFLSLDLQKIFSKIVYGLMRIQWCGKFWF